MNFTINFKALINNQASEKNLEDILGRARAKKGMFEGDLVEWRVGNWTNCWNY